MTANLITLVCSVATEQSSNADKLENLLLATLSTIYLHVGLPRPALRINWTPGSCSPSADSSASFRPGVFRPHSAGLFQERGQGTLGSGRGCSHCLHPRLSLPQSGHLGN